MRAVLSAAIMIISSVCSRVEAGSLAQRLLKAWSWKVWVVAMRFLERFDCHVWCHFLQVLNVMAWSLESFECHSAPYGSVCRIRGCVRHANRCRVQCKRCLRGFVGSTAPTVANVCTSPLQASYAVGVKMETSYAVGAQAGDESRSWKMSFSRVPSSR